ncbi:MAG: TetR/AcrR family transcriptional regulator [Gluconacetobacter diazotrophicus]|nr:TetR/AcrR family transcriptional regulator [Gluconacetobacter diazotrophicus]
MGRPRKFDEEVVLERAMLLFWRRGYDGTSTGVLLDVMGMTNSSLYQAFGSKAELFRRVTERYRSGPLAFRLVALAEATPRAVVEKVLSGTVALLSGPDRPPGCLEVVGGLPAAQADAAVRELLIGKRAVLRELLRERLEAVAGPDGMPGGITAADMAALVATVAHGLAVQAGDGMDRAGMQRVVAAFMAGWD